jgi:RNA polymerase sigma-70 factor (ECF subfamily)
VGKPESANPPAAPAAAASQPSGVFHASGRELVLATLEAEGAFLKNFLRKGLRKMLATRNFDTVNDLAEDAFQNLHLRALEVVETYDPAKPAGAWLVGIAMKVLQEQNPKRRKSATSVSDLGSEGQQVLESAPQTGNENPLDRLERLENLAQLGETMAKLSALDQEVLRLTLIEERDTAKVATILKITSDQVHMRKCRALKRLRALCATTPEVCQ